MIFLQVSFQNGPSPTSVLKLNVDAGLFGGIATLVVVARNDSGSILQCWTKRCNTIDPCFAEAAALLWALELPRDNHFPKIMVEGDAKICIEAIFAGFDTIPWKILFDSCKH
jgi:ribonuclease HI